MRCIRISFSFMLLFITAMAMAQPKDVAFTEYKISPTECTVLTHSSGTEIFIPKNAFQLSANQKCDVISLKYREFHTQADIVVAKIPMTFQQSGRNLLMESGGMFEISTECNGEEVKLAAGKQIQIRLKSKTAVNDLQAFYFNPQSMSWDKIQSPVVDFSYADTALQQWGNIPPRGLNNVEVVELQIDPFDPFVTRADTVVRAEFKEGIFKSMNISRMGLYNYDRIIEDESQVFVSADVRLEGSAFPIEGTVYVAYKSLNSVIYFDVNQLKDRFWLLPRKDLIMFAILKDGTVAVLPDNKVKKLDFKKLQGNSYVFELKPMDKPKDKQQLAQITGIRN